jgi:branched-chain amino acid transport system ATP-binding protein
MAKYQNMLVAIDPNQDDQPALRRAVYLHQRIGGKIKAFLPIYDFSYEMTTLLSPDERTAMRQGVIGQRTAWIREQAKFYLEAGVPIDIKVVWHNRPFEAIIQEVISGEHDLLLKMAHQHDKLEAVIFTPTDWQTAKIMREAVAIVPEGRRVFSRMTVEENLAMGGFFADRDQFQTRIKWVYELFPRLWERRIQRAGTMSGGEQQMLAIGRALMSQPRLLLLDEPSLGLAPIIIQQIFDTIEQLRKEGMTIFLVEQNANQALKLADRGYVLENGRVVLEDTGDALLANEAVRSAYLGG